MPNLITTRVIRECMPLTASESGSSIGEQIDMALEAAIHEGHEMQSVELHFESEEWHAYAHARATGRGPVDSRKGKRTYPPTDYADAVPVR